MNYLEKFKIFRHFKALRVTDLLQQMLVAFRQFTNFSAQVNFGLFEDVSGNVSKTNSNQRKSSNIPKLI